MPTKVEKDAVTGKTTTGHEWDGIKELNTPLPKWWLYVLYATIAWSVVWWVLYPSWPWLTGYFGGILGYNQRRSWTNAWPPAERRGRSTWSASARRRSSRSRRIRSSPTSRSPAAAPRSPTTARPAMGSAAPARASTRGSPTTPGSGAARSTRSSTPSSTASAATTPTPASTRCRRSARLDMLTASEISDVAEHVLALSGRSEHHRGGGARRRDLRRAMRGLPRRAGQGQPELGAPDLDRRDLALRRHQGGDRAQIHSPRHGVMPAWAGRLDPRRSRSWPSTSTPWAAASKPGAVGGLTRQHDERRRHPGRGRALVQGAEEGPALCRARQDLPQGGRRPLPQDQMGGADRAARHLLRRALAALGPRPGRAGPGGADRHAWPARVLLLDRDLAAGSLLPDLLADARRLRPVPRDQHRGPRVVRLHLPADRLDRPVHVGRAPDRGRPRRPHPPRQGAARRARRSRKKAPSTPPGC